MRGSIIKRNGSWGYVIDVPGGKDGRRRQRSRQNFETRREAEKALASVAAELARGTFVEPSRMLFGDFLTQKWLPTVDMSIKRATSEFYHRIVRLRLLPALGHTRMDQIVPEALNELYRELLDDGRLQNRERQGRGLSPRSVTMVHITIKKALNDAVRWGYLARNPADGVSAPSRRQHWRTREVWSATDLRWFLDETDYDRLHALWVLLALTGMRRGEALALRWADVDWHRKTVTISRNLCESIGHEPYFDTPKTKHGCRTIGLDLATIQELLGHRGRQEYERRSAEFMDQDLIFCRPDGSPLRPGSVTQRFVDLVGALDMPRIALHGLRHTHATLALQAGINPKVISERLGHASIAITLDIYSHVMPHLDQEAAERIAKEIMGRSPSRATYLRAMPRPDDEDPPAAVSSLR
jgi:integrase